MFTGEETDHGRRAHIKNLIWDYQKDITAYLPPGSGISEHELVLLLIARLTAARRRKRSSDGCQAKEALGNHWQGRWPDDNGGGGPAPLNREMVETKN